jgi:hypothetical protein
VKENSLIKITLNQNSLIENYPNGKIVKSEFLSDKEELENSDTLA